MASLDQFTPTAQAVIKIFAYPFRSAPTADLITWGVNTLQAGTPAATLLNTLFALPVPQSPFTIYAPGSTSQAFVTALVDNLSFATDIGATVKAGWVEALLPMLAAAPSRGDFVVQVALLIEGYTGSDTQLLALKSALAQRAETAASFALTPAGAVYDGNGFAQLLAPLTPVPPPTYALTAAGSVNEGQALVFTLKTTHVAPGTVLPYAVSGVSAADLQGGALSGSLTLDSTGQATLTLSLLADATTEGAETLTVTIGDALAQASATVNDTSTTPPPPPVYTLGVDRTTADEGTAVVFTLVTSNVATGTSVPYTLSGTGITSADIGGTLLAGLFVVDANGRATVTLNLTADALTEGAEVLRLTLDGRGIAQDVNINDTSTTPPPPPTKDTVIVADVLNNSRARPPATPAEGEIEFDTWLTYDFLNQSGSTPRRMTVAELKATGDVPGAPLVTTNSSADRGNVPQVSNQHLVTYDLGADIDRVDYSAEGGKVAALVSLQVPAGRQLVLINDDSLNTTYNNATDRIDTLIGVEELVAARGTGVIDLTASGKDWEITFSRGFDTAPEVIAASDREVHRVLLADPATGAAYGTSLIEFRDAGLDNSITQATALWNEVQGSDRNETLVFSASESTDDRLNALRGGSNAVKYGQLTRSILVDVAAMPWAASSSPADDTNSSGRWSAVTRFTNGDGNTLLSSASHITTWHGADNRVSAGSLLFIASQDVEDTLSFDSVTASKTIAIGQKVNGLDAVQVRLTHDGAAYSLTASGFDWLVDNGASDDLFWIGSLSSAVQTGPRLRDAMANDHDGVSIGDSALGTAAVGGVVSVVNLAILNSMGAGFNFDFDVLDISRLTQRVSALGTPGTDDELVAGPMALLAAATSFESLVLSESSLDLGAAFTLNLDSGNVLVGSAVIPFGGTHLSAGGTVLGQAGAKSAHPALDAGVGLTVVDGSPGAGATLWGGNGADLLRGDQGDDVLRGGPGNDSMSGGSRGETWAFTLTGMLDANAGNRTVFTLTVDSTVLTLSEAATADTTYGDQNGAVVDGSTASAVAQALTAMINANLTLINGGAGNGVLTGATYEAVNNRLVLSFREGLDVNDTVSLNVALNGDTGTLAVGAGVNVPGTNGGIDRYVFESTAALNGVDQIADFSPASDRLDLTAWIGGSVTSTSTPIDLAAGGTLFGSAARLERVFNKPDGLLTVQDFSSIAFAGKLSLVDNGRCIVVVSADPTGARGDAANTPMRVYLVENGAASGLGDLTVSLVGVVSSPTELTMAEMANAFS